MKKDPYQIQQVDIRECYTFSHLRQQYMGNDVLELRVETGKNYILPKGDEGYVAKAAHQCCRQDLERSL